MSLGGGIFLTQNKVLPGAYINFVSAAKASAQVGERGYCALGLCLDWGCEDSIFTVTGEDMQLNSLRLFGYQYTAPQLKYLREAFLNAKTLYCYRLNGGGTRAENTYCRANYSGIRGNDLTLVIEENPEGSFDVATLLEGYEVDRQTVAKAGELKANSYVSFIPGAELTPQAGIPLTGGTNGSVTGLKHQEFLDKAEAYSYNVLACPYEDKEVKALYAAYTRRMRDEVGAKMQCVLFDYPGDYEGIINVKNPVEGDDSRAALVYWVAGLMAGCEINRSALNTKYNGELQPYGDYTQAQLKEAINSGEFALHNVGGDMRVLADINSLVSYSDTKGDYFADNQTIRVCDRIANDIALIFNTRYLGKVPNDAAGRTALWNDIVSHHKQLNDIRAIEDFDEKDITVTQGATKRAVVVNEAISIVCAMGKLYMTVTVE